MKMEKFLKALIALGVISACSVLIACSGGTQTTGSGGAAATVNGTEIPEATVTDYVQNIRGQYSLDDDDSWGQFLSANAMTPESLREQTINSLVDKELLKKDTVCFYEVIIAPYDVPADFFADGLVLFVGPDVILVFALQLYKAFVHIVHAYPVFLSRHFSVDFVVIGGISHVVEVQAPDAVGQILGL